MIAEDDDAPSHDELRAYVPKADYLGLDGVGSVAG